MLEHEFVIKLYKINISCSDMRSEFFIRPIWICGRFNSDKHAALIYNLIEGLVYFFKGQAADIVGEIIKTDPNKELSIYDLCLKFSIRKDKLHSFLCDLLQRGILSPKIMDETGILNYRRQVGEKRLDYLKSHPFSADITVEESAENAYREYVNPTIGVVQIELTYNCSERCVHCYNPGATRNDNEKSKRYRGNELKLDDYIRIIDELYNLGVYKINLTGGDPFSKPIIWDIVAYLHKKGIAFDIYTNGQVLSDKESMNRLLTYFPKSVSVSVYGGDETVHDRITRVSGSFNKTMDTLEQLSAFGVPFAIKCSIMKWNIKSYPAVVDIAKRYGGIIQYDYKLIDSLDGDKCVSHYFLLDEDELELVMQDDYVREKIYVEEKVMKDDKPCNAGYLFFCISPEGNVQPCNSFPWSLGNLKEQSFSDILNHSSRLKEWRKTRVSDFVECGHFDYCNYCNICVGNIYCENGSLFKPSALSCKLAKVRYKLIKRKEKGISRISRNALLDALSKIDVNLQIPHKMQGENYRV